MQDNGNNRNRRSQNTAEEPPEILALRAAIRCAQVAYNDDVKGFADNLTPLQDVVGARQRLTVAHEELARARAHARAAAPAPASVPAPAAPVDPAADPAPAAPRQTALSTIALESRINALQCELEILLQEYVRRRDEELAEQIRREQLAVTAADEAAAAAAVAAAAAAEAAAAVRQASCVAILAGYKLSVICNMRPP
jgi:hypothetical protein